MTIACLRRLEDLFGPNSNVHVLISVGNNQHSVLHGVADVQSESLRRTNKLDDSRGRRLSATLGICQLSTIKYPTSVLFRLSFLKILHAS